MIFLFRFPPPNLGRESFSRFATRSMIGAEVLSLVVHAGAAVQIADSMTHVVASMARAGVLAMPVPLGTPPDSHRLRRRSTLSCLGSSACDTCS